MDLQDGEIEDIEPFMDPVFENNVILTETERLTMNSDQKPQSMPEIRM